MGCCTSNSSKRVKEPVRVMRHREDYVEDEKEGDDAKGNYDKKQSFPYTVLEQPVKVMEEKSPLENKAPEVSRVVESRVDNLETEIKPETKPESKPESQIKVENIEDMPAMQKVNKESQHVDRFIEGEDLTRVTRKDPEPLGNMEMSGLNEIKGVKSDDNMVESRQRLYSEESGYKVTREQHAEILRFVDERRSYMQGQVYILYQSLVQHVKEDEGLALMIEDLKSWNKDVENCVDDLKCYRFQDDEIYLEGLTRNSSLIKKVVFGFGTYKKNLKPYKEFKDETLAILRSVDPRMEENSQAYMKLSMGGSLGRRRMSDRPPTSLTFIPKEEVRENEGDQSNVMEDQVDLRFDLK